MDLYLKQFLVKSKDRISDDDQLQFLKRMHRLLDNGYSLLDTLEVMTWDKQLANTAEQIINSLKNGFSLEQALSNCSFHSSIVNYISFANTNQNIEENIQRCYMMFEQRLNNLKKFKHLLRYPLILLSLFLPLLFILKQSVLPSFLELYQQSPSSSSLIIFSIFLIDWLGLLLILTCLGIGGIAILWKIYNQRLPIEKKLRVYQRIPIFRTYIKLQTSFLFASQFSTLIKTGMSFKDVLDQMIYQEKQPIISYYCRRMGKQLSNGHPIPTLISQFFFLEMQLTAIFQRSNNNQALETDLFLYAEILLEEIQRKLVKYLTYIQPVFFIIIACFILFVYITLMWPMFQLVKTI
ncbi:competence type IV pilus assembly protein ComGB [Virgibacillus salexigens]|uniref:Competence protein ComG n=1 Tax=Virgibacillus kapii TaxID=1638645 RepID=A0ABQ2D8V6_9BACI|nr:competence type IV pilus assembly protein ComGB [Virgibacillus kapii]GGJ47592.1 competence protein ComG [Virgibacillus kapii]